MEPQPRETEDLQKTPDEQVFADMWALLRKLRATKPEDRSERDRLYAIVITDMQKLIGFFESWILYEFDEDA